MKKVFRNFLICLSAFWGLVTLVGTLLFVFNVVALAVNVFTFIFFGIEILLISVFCYVIYLAIKARKKRKEDKLVEQIQKDREQQLLALYKSFGIPPQRNKDGSLKNFYELLGLEPQFDEFGERVPTIYELLHIVPKFDQNCNEIPVVVFIKNKAVKACTKVPPQLAKMKKKLSKEEQDRVKREQQLVTAVKIAKLSGDNKKAKSATKKLNGMPPRKQKVAPMKTTATKNKAFSIDKIEAGALLKFGFEIKLPNIEKFMPKEEPEKAKAQKDEQPDVKEGPIKQPVEAAPAQPVATRGDADKKDELPKIDVDEKTENKIHGQEIGGKDIGEISEVNNIEKMQELIGRSANDMIAEEQHEGV